MPALESLTFSALDVPLLEPFGIATGAHASLENVLVRLQLDDGTVGWGEAAPVAHISGETRSMVLGLEADAGCCLQGIPLEEYRRVSARLGEALGTVPSAWAGVEMALFDALCRRYRTSLFRFFGGKDPEITTDITVTTGDVEHARRSAERAVAAGFEVFKIKVGGARVEDDCSRVEAICEIAPRARLILDGNTAFDVAGAVEFVESLGPLRTRLLLFEQPVPREDIEGLAEVEARSRVPVAADESLRSAADLRAILRTGGISAINIKTTKLGVVQAWDLLVAARTAGLDVMVGGMVETELAMSVSACLAAGVGGVRYVDLDTPLFLAERRVKSELGPWGPRLELTRVTLGHGVTAPGLSAPRVEEQPNGARRATNDGTP